jgi:Tfp pilus assembly protein PilX
MNIPQIRMESTFAKIGIETQSAQLQIQQPHADMSIEQPKAEMMVDRRPSRLTIDQTRAFEDANLKSVSRMIDDAAQAGYQAAMNAIASKAQDGDELMMIEHGFSALPNQAQRNSETPPADFNIGWIPSHNSVKINYDPGETNIRWNSQPVKIDVRPNKPIIDYYPGKTNIYLQQKNSLRIDFEA